MLKQDGDLWFLQAPYFQPKDAPMALVEIAKESSPRMKAAQPTMLKVRMLKDAEGSPDGIRVRQYKAGEVHELPAGPWPLMDLGKVFIDMGVGEEVLPESNDTAEKTEQAAAPKAEQEPAEKQEHLTVGKAEAGPIAKAQRKEKTGVEK